MRGQHQVKMKLYSCPKCGDRMWEDKARTPVEGKASGAGLGLLAGACTRDPLVAIGLALIGGLIGHLADELAPECPECAVALELLGTYLREVTL